MLMPDSGLIPTRTTASSSTCRLFTISASPATTSGLRGTLTLRDGASAGASCTASPTFTSTFVAARHVRGRSTAIRADAKNTSRKTPTTRRRCLKTE